VREGKRPERTIYQITDDGAREMNEWMTELISVPGKEYPAFMAGLSFLASLHPDEALMALRSRADALKLRLLSMRGTMKAAREAGLPRLFELEEEYEESQLAAELKFVTELIADMVSGDLQGMELWGQFHTEGFDPEEVEFTFELPEE
jgi:DNA-binding PadR family transcriptional regulator